MGFDQSNLSVWSLCLCQLLIITCLFSHLPVRYTKLKALNIILMLFLIEVWLIYNVLISAVHINMLFSIFFSIMVYPRIDIYLNWLLQLIYNVVFIFHAALSKLLENCFFFFCPQSDTQRMNEVNNAHSILYLRNHD